MKQIIIKDSFTNKKALKDLLQGIINVFEGKINVFWTKKNFKILRNDCKSDNNKYCNDGFIEFIEYWNDEDTQTALRNIFLALLDLYFTRNCFSSGFRNQNLVRSYSPLNIFLNLIFRSRLKKREALKISAELQNTFAWISLLAFGA